MRLKIYSRVIWIVLPVFAFPVSGAVAIASPDPTIPISGTVQAPIRSLDEVMVSLLHKINCTAGALAISKGDTLLYERSYGWLDREHKIPAPVNAYIGLASCEKPITAAAVRRLAAIGKLNLAKLVQKLPMLAKGNSDASFRVKL